MCDHNKDRPIITLFKTNDGRICGGYTSKRWNMPESECSKWKEDRSSYLFSVDLQRIFRILNPGEAIRCDIESGPCFGDNGCLGALESPFNGIGKCICSVNSDTYESTSDSNGLSLLTGKKDNFTAVEIEVFHF